MRARTDEDQCSTAAARMTPVKHRVSCHICRGHWITSSMASPRICIKCWDAGRRLDGDDRTGCRFCHTTSCLRAKHPPTWPAMSVPVRCMTRQLEIDAGRVAP